jgi:hypothetical protein
MKNSTSKKTMLLFLFFALFYVGKVSAQLTLTVTITNATNCTSPNCNGSASVPTLAGATYAWNTNPVQTTPTATGLCPGTYSITATLAPYGSGSGSGTVGCGNNGVFDLTTASVLNLFPNPAVESVSLDLSSATYGNYSLSVITILGETIHTEKISVNGNLNKLIDISALSRGVYFIELRNEKNFYAGKLLKQ